MEFFFLSLSRSLAQVSLHSIWCCLMNIIRWTNSYKRKTGAQLNSWWDKTKAVCLLPSHFIHNINTVKWQVRQCLTHYKEILSLEVAKWTSYTWTNNSLHQIKLVLAGFKGVLGTFQIVRQKKKKKRLKTSLLRPAKSSKAAYIGLLLRVIFILFQIKLKSHQNISCKTNRKLEMLKH